jgi:hypothetical protein
VKAAAIAAVPLTCDAQDELASRGLKVATGRSARAHLKCRDHVRQATHLGLEHGSGSRPPLPTRHARAVGLLSDGGADA